MQYENCTFTCPVCGNQEQDRVRYAGESDGGATGTLNPDNCTRCKGWKEASPALYETLRYHYDRAEKMKETTEKSMDKYYSSHIHPHALSNSVSWPNHKEEWLKRFNERRARANKLASHSSGIDGEWVMEKSILAVINLFAKQVEKHSKLFHGTK